MQQDCSGLELHQKVEHIIEHSGLIGHHEKEGGEKARARIENLEELITAAGSFEEASFGLSAPSPLIPPCDPPLTTR